MATRTSVQTGLWSAAATWDTGVPADGDDAVVATTHTVTYDADQSLFTTGISVDIVGTLRWTTTAAAVTYMKLKNVTNPIRISSGGSLYIGNSTSDRLPRGSSHTLMFHQTGGSASSVAGAVACCIYGWTPTTFWTTLAADASTGATQVVFTDDLDLLVNEQIAIACGTVYGVITAETTAKWTYTVTAYDAPTKTATITPGLRSYDRKAGDYVAMLTRPIVMDRVTASNSYYGFSGRVGMLNEIYGVMWMKDRCSSPAYQYGCVGLGSMMVYGSTPSVASGANGIVVTLERCMAIAAASYVSNGYSGAVVRDCLSIGGGGINMATGDALMERVISQNSSYILATGGRQMSIRDCTVKRAGSINTLTSGGVDVDNLTLINPGPNSGGTIGSGIWGVVKNCDASTVYNFIVACGGKLRLINCTGSTNVFFPGYNSRNWRSPTSFVESYDHQGSAGAYMAWTLGGVVSSVADVVPPGETVAYRLALESADYWGYRERQVHVPAGETIRVDAWLRSDYTGDDLPRITLADLDNDPLVDSDYSYLASVVAPNTASTWNKVCVTWTNTGDARDVWVRFMARRASGNAWCTSEWKVTGPAGGWSTWG